MSPALGTLDGLLDRNVFHAPSVLQKFPLPSWSDVKPAAVGAMGHIIAAVFILPVLLQVPHKLPGMPVSGMGVPWSDPGAPASTHPLSTTLVVLPEPWYETHTGTLAFSCSPTSTTDMTHMADEGAKPPYGFIPLNEPNVHDGRPSCAGKMGLVPWQAS
jgi:hypothetical protein